MTTNHPDYYGGEDDPYEAIKVAEAWGLDKDAYLFNVLKYVARAGKKTPDPLQDLQKAAFYLQRRITRLDDSNASATGSEVNHGVLRIGARVKVKQGKIPTEFITNRLGKEGVITGISAQAEWAVMFGDGQGRLGFYTDELEVIG